MCDRQLHCLPDYKFNEHTFNEYYSELEQYINTSKPIKYHIVLPLENFDCTLDTPVIQLSNNIRIISASSTFYPDIIEEDKDRWMNELCYDVDYYCPPKFFLEIDRIMKRKTVLSSNEENIFDDMKDKWREALKILMLFNEGDLSFGYAYLYSKLPCDPQYIGDTMLAYKGNYDTPNKYILKGDDIKNLQLLFTKYLSNKKKEGFPQSSIDYLYEGADEKKPEKRLLDYCNGLERLLVKEQTNTKDLLAKRVANFIGENKEGWIEIHENVENVYRRFRNKLSHGNKDEVSLSECKEHCKTMENYTRQVINKCLNMVDKGLTKQDFLKIIETVPFPR
jgi:hypothetical protein